MSDFGLGERLAALRKAQLWRRPSVLDSPQQPVVRLADGRRMLNFCSNDYLGLASHPRVCAALQGAARRYGVGSGASQLVCGRHRLHQRLEEELAAFSGRPRALLFSCGYMANLGVIGALMGRGDLILEDRRNHASLLDAGLLCRGRMERFRHRDLEDLAGRLRGHSGGRRLIAVEGVFSMDGDLAPLSELAPLARRHDAWLMVDDAHGIGCLGDTGGGALQHFGLGLEEAPVLMGTLGKALGTAGAFVAGSEELVETLLQCARSYIYTTAPPAALAAASCAALEVLRENPGLVEKLRERVRYFRRGAQQRGILLPQDALAAIQPVLLGEAAAALRVGEALAQRGLLVTPIRPPTVPAGTARLRITLSAAHEHAQLDRLLDALAELLPGEALAGRHSEDSEASGCSVAASAEDAP